MSRFKPVRAGIIGVWDYQDQEFRFADGRLVLRGPNGSGKTKALEVLVPFVLDGSIDARRLDPFSGHERTMRSNLLFGDQKAGHGYCWLEFARGDEHVTIGVGLRAQAQTQKVKTWFFVADASVGDGVELLGRDRVPATHKELRAQSTAIRVFERREAYRAAVDQRLFGLGVERYRALIELMLTLRRPQLAKGLDPDALSDVLSDGLRTIDRELLRTSAQAFDNLEVAQRELTELEGAAKASGELLRHWRAYLRARAQERVQRTIELSKRLAVTRTKMEEAEGRIVECLASAEAAHARVVAAQRELDRQHSAIDALKSREAYRNRGQLDDLREAVADAKNALGRAENARRRAEGALQEAQQDLDSAAGAREQAASAARDSEGRLVAHCRIAGHAPSEPLDPDEVGAWLALRSESTAAVMERVEELEVVQRQEFSAEQQLQKAVVAAEAAAERLAQAKRELKKTLDDAELALVGWHRGLRDELRHEQPLPDLLARLPDLGDDLDLGAMVASTWSKLRDETLRRKVRAEAELKRASDAISSLARDIEATRARRQDSPPAPHTRQAQRDGRPGAPLWRLVRFREDVSDASQAGLEGALLASGLLDAWVDPDAETEDFARADTALSPIRPATGPTLANVLAPEEQAHVATERVAALLASIALEDAEIAAGCDGRFRLGPLFGSNRPEQARYIGATARERYRAERIARLESEVRAEKVALAATEAEIARCDELTDAMSLAIQGLPEAAAARAARKEIDKATGTVRQAEDARAEADKARSALARKRVAARRALLQTAAEHGVPSEPDEVRSLGKAVVAAQSALKDVRALRAQLRARDDALRGVERRHAAAGGALAKAREDLDEATRTHEAKSVRLERLVANLGAEVEQINAAIAAASQAASTAEQARGQAAAEERKAEDARNRQVGVRDTEVEKLPDQEADLAQAEASLSPFTALSVQAVLDIDDQGAPFAERLAAAVAGASFTAEQIKTTETRLSNRLAELDDALGARFHSVRSTDDGIVLVKIADEEGEHGPARFDARLQERLSTARQLLDAQERRLFEDQLLGTLCAQLSERLDEATSLVKAMDRAMRQRVLTSRKSLGVSWRALPDADPARKELLSLLKFDAAFLTPDRLSRVRALLSDEVQSARRDRPDRTYLEILEGALDYRRWHRFELTLFDAAGGASRLSRAAHSRLSGGEKAATLHLPLFAAAHAHFEAGDPDCPRLVALDEAFAGIDDNGVPELLRLAADFDLDWFLTGFDLWVTEPFLPGVMHYDLAHDPRSGVVSAWPVLWNGSETVEGDEVAR